jgi:hypothetical protein
LNSAVTFATVDEVSIRDWRSDRSCEVIPWQSDSEAYLVVFGEMHRAGQDRVMVVV